MGQLLKKKPVGQKKKKENSTEGNGENGLAQETVGILENTIPYAAVGETRKKTAGQDKKTFGADKSDKKREENFLDRTIQFFREVRTELKRVAWPSRTQTIGSTVVVLVLTMIISLFLGLVDFSLSNIVRIVLG